MTPKRYPLPKRFNAALSEKAYANLRELNHKYQYGNNYLLTILLENLDKIARQDAVEKIFSEFEKEYGAPSGNPVKNKGHAEK